MILPSGMWIVGHLDREVSMYMVCVHVAQTAVLSKILSRLLYTGVNSDSTSSTTT